jgi:hypothetical protein
MGFESYISSYTNDSRKDCFCHFGRFAQVADVSDLFTAFNAHTITAGKQCHYLFIVGDKTSGFLKNKLKYKNLSLVQVEFFSNPWCLPLS